MILNLKNVQSLAYDQDAKDQTIHRMSLEYATAKSLEYATATNMGPEVVLLRCRREILHF